MFALLIASLILTAAFLFGAEVLALTCLRRRDDLPLAERWAFSLGLGIILMGYVVLALGLLGHLTRPIVLIAAAACGVVGLRQAPLLGRAVRTLALAVWRGLFGRSGRRLLHAFLAVWVLVVALGTLAPPGDSDYDGLSQHLASPKLYLRHGAITPLWFDHHSNFPSTLQMLFTVALAAGSPEAAKVLHLGCALAAALVLIVIGRRFLSPAAGEWAAFVLLTVPLTAWLGQVAYVDLAGVLFAALTLLGFLLWDRDRTIPSLLLAAVGAGGGAAVKAQGLQVLGLAVLCVLVASWWARAGLGRALRDAAVLAAVAVALCGAWYVKSAVWTGNPVYPFAYGIFGGKYWSQAQADDYQEAQLAFGVGRLPASAERARMGFLARTFCGPRAPVNLLSAPWNLVTEPWQFEVPGISRVYAVIGTSISPLFLGLLPLLLLARPPRAVGWSLAWCAPLWLAWLVLMQYNRYLIPALALAAVPVGYVLGDLLPERGLARMIPRAVAGCWGVLALGYLALGVFAGDAWQVSLGLVSRADYLDQHSESFRFAQFVNTETPPDARIALYSEPRGFYLDREYLWAEAGHSTLIDYGRIHSGDDLLREFRRLGITHILYHSLSRDDVAFAQPQIGPPLQELNRRGLVDVIGSPPRDPSYTLFAINTGVRAGQ